MLGYVVCLCFVLFVCLLVCLLVFCVCLIVYLLVCLFCVCFVFSLLLMLWLLFVVVVIGFVFIIRRWSACVGRNSTHLRVGGCTSVHASRFFSDGLAQVAQVAQTVSAVQLVRSHSRVASSDMSYQFHRVSPKSSARDAQSTLAQRSIEKTCFCYCCCCCYCVIVLVIVLVIVTDCCCCCCVRRKARIVSRSNRGLLPLRVNEMLLCLLSGEQPVLEEFVLEREV